MTADVKVHGYAGKASQQLTLRQWLTNITNLNRQTFIDVRSCLDLVLNFYSNTKDAFFTAVERSVANVDAMKYRSWLTNKSFLNSF